MEEEELGENKQGGGSFRGKKKSKSGIREEKGDEKRILKHMMAVKTWC